MLEIYSEKQKNRQETEQKEKTPFRVFLTENHFFT